MEQKVYIIGHKNPDTDSICSAIGYCYYKKMTGHDNVCAARLGDINKETEFVLNYFNIAPPKMITTVKMQVKDLGIDRVVSISPDTTVLKAWTIMKKKKVKTLPVVDDFGQLLGVCTVSNLTNSYMDVSYNNLFANSNTSTENVLDTLSGTIVNNVTFNFSETSQIIVAAMDENEVVRRVGPNDIVITGDRD
ncbi:MAG TPA: inorganic diphosphatase, partial [Clostridiaceae bacterium]|nr:inorganic diphosphatase [Clostridiaceae bacterium]